MISKQKESSTELVPVKFSRLTRRGILLGLSLSQLITLATGVLSVVVALYAGGASCWPTPRRSGCSPQP